MEPPPVDRHRWPPMSYWAKVTVTIALTLYVLALAKSVLNIIILVVIAAVLAIGLDPAVRRLERLDMRRGYAVTLIFFGFALFVALFAYLVVPPLVHQVTGLADDIPQYASQLASRHDWIGSYFREHDVAESVKTFVADLPSRISSSFSTILGVAGKVTGALFNVVTVAILMIYFMLALPSMRRTAAVLFVPERRERAERVMDQSVSKIGGYVSGNLVTSIICGALALIALVIFGVPFAVPLAMWAGLADLIPTVGSYLGAAPAVIVGLFQSPITGLLVLLYFLAYQQFENYFLVPKVMQNAVDLSPAAVIISTLTGGSLFGFAGALLALPVAATIKVILWDVWLRERAAGDALVQEHIEAGLAAEAEAEAEAEARAQRRRQVLERIRGWFGGGTESPTSRDSSEEESEEEDEGTRD
jgi:predicted PurR-regulated permease PerM